MDPAEWEVVQRKADAFVSKEEARLREELTVSAEYLLESVEAELSRAVRYATRMSVEVDAVRANEDRESWAQISLLLAEALSIVLDASSASGASPEAERDEGGRAEP